MGAGSVGCYVGGRLQATGRDVVLVGRERGKAEIEAHGLTTVDLEGHRSSLTRDDVTFLTDVASLAGCEVVLCCVKSGQTEETGRTLAGVLAPGAMIVSMQNGVRNAERLQEQAPAQVVLRPEARSSMWEDLERRRPTEVDHLNGELVRAAEPAGRGSPGLDARALWEELHA